MKISDGIREIDTENVILRSLNSFLSIAVLENDPTYGDHILFSLNDERINHNQLEGLNQDDHKHYLDQARHLALHMGDLGANPTISLERLIDVSIINPKHPEVLKFNGSYWSNALITHHELVNLDEYDDHKQYLNPERHNLSSHVYYNPVTETGNLPHDKLSKLEDVGVNGIQNGQILHYQSGYFIPRDLPVYDINHKHNDDYIRRDGTNTPTSNLNMDGRRLINLGTPINATDAATKGMIDAIVWRAPVIAIVNSYPASPVNGNRYAVSHNAEDDSIRGQIIEYQNGWKITPAVFGNAFFNIQDKKPYYWSGTMFNTFGNTIPVEDMVMRNGSTPLLGDWDTGDYTIRTPNAVQFDDVANKLDVYARFAQMTFLNPVIDLQLPNHDVPYPQDPHPGDRYIATWGSIPGSTPQCVFECYETAGGAKWLVSPRKKGMVVYSLYHERYYCYNGNAWVRFEKAFDIRELNYGDLHIDHGSLAGNLDDDHPQYLKTDGSRVLTGDFDSGGFKLTNLHDGTEDTDAVTYKQLMLVSTGIHWIEPVDVISNTPDITKRILVGTEPTGDFVGHAGEIADYDGSWSFTVPDTGDACLVESTGDQYQWNGDAWVKIFNGTTHANLVDAGSATNHNRYLRNDADGTETGMVTFNPTVGSWPFQVNAAKTGRVANLNADKTDGYDAMDDPSIPQAERLVVTDEQSGITVNTVSGSAIRVRDESDYTELTTEILGTEATHYITLTDLTTRIIRSNAQRMFLGESEVLTTENISTADVDMVDGKHASDFAEVNHTHIDEIALNDLSDVDVTGADENYVVSYSKANAMWMAKKFNEITTLAHASLAQLYTDDHLQYIHVSNPRTITAQHTFNTNGAPFIIGPNAEQVVTGLNADMIDGKHASDFIQGDHTHDFKDLSDVIITNPLVDQVFALNADGYLVNKNISDIFEIPEGVLTPPEEIPHDYQVLFSNGSGGTFVNGIKTNIYNQMDMNYNRVKNAIIDCGAFYA